VTKWVVLVVGHAACHCNSWRGDSMVNKSQICKLPSHFSGFFW